MNKKLEPIRDNNLFGLSQHKFNSFSAIVDHRATEKDLTDKAFWVNFARQMSAGDEIRCIADDGSFIAYLVVMFVNGTDTMMHCTGFHKVADVDKKASDQGDYEIKNGGAAGWYVKVKATGERLWNKGFSTQSEAIRELDEYLKALAA